MDAYYVATEHTGFLAVQLSWWAGAPAEGDPREVVYQLARTDRAIPQVAALAPAAEQALPNRVPAGLKITGGLTPEDVRSGQTLELEFQVVNTGDRPTQILDGQRAFLLVDAQAIEILGGQSQ